MATYYVRKSGSDANVGTSAALAKLTIGSAISASTTGDTIYIGAGIYHETAQLVSKNTTFIGDITGANTGDAGEVILTGWDSTDAAYTHYGGIFEFLDMQTGGTIQNVNFADFYSYGANFSNNAINYVVGTNDGNLSNPITLDTVTFRNCVINRNNGIESVLSIVSAAYAVTLKKVFVDGLGVASYSSSTAGINVTLSGSGSLTMENCEVKNVMATTGGVCGIRLNGGNTSGNSTITNCKVSNIYISGNLPLNGFNVFNAGTGAGSIKLYNCVVLQLWDFEASATIKPYASIAGTTNLYAYNCTGISFNGVYTTVDSQYTATGAVNKAGYFLTQPEYIPRYSPLIGQGNSTYAADDILGNPRPAYGNTNANIGSSEATAQDAQQETTVYDTSSTSLRVQPPRMWKRTFQIPVVASTLRTVTVKIRIDGTWGLAKYPKVTLSGQGMTASTATKSSTTGAFQTLTVSGTPTTTGIALLTIEMHETDTSAIAYIDTITVS